MKFEGTWYSQDLAKIASSGEAAAVKEFELFNSAGLDAVSLLLGPRMLPSSQFSRGLELVARVADRSNSTKVIPELWADPLSDDFKSFGQNVKRFMDAHPNAFLSRDGKPVFAFAFDSKSMAKVHDPYSGASKKIDEFLAPWGGSEFAYIIYYVPYDLNKAIESPLVHEADAVAVWTPQDDWSALHSSVVFKIASSLHKDAVFPVSPSFYQRRAGQFPMEYGNSFGAARYIDGWLEALRKRPAFVNIQTWNDFSEDTAIVPSSTAGETWLHLTAYFSSWLKTGFPPNRREERVMLLRPKQLVRAKLDNAGAKTINAAWRHGSPTVDYIDVVTILREPALVRLTLGSQIWELPVPAGIYEWLVRSNEAGSPGQSSYPTDTKLRHVTLAGAFESAVPVVQLFRGENLIGVVESKAPLLDKGGWQDFTIIADEAVLHSEQLRRKQPVEAH
ncbi:hypothetical protein AOQ71_02280 [Bradyrhizobium manausense]|uniref:Glycosyl hydrolase family 71 n=1 Tax=Bradyrhizobium manausense TaxID=989370 RepID=A0A0R3ECZ1_9BRAD|nr:hypothetical protein AOQ71_02280 [Bradyrhizobium manausense]